MRAASTSSGRSTPGSPTRLRRLRFWSAMGRSRRRTTRPATPSFLRPRPAVMLPDRRPARAPTRAVIEGSAGFVYRIYSSPTRGRFQFSARLQLPDARRLDRTGYTQPDWLHGPEGDQQYGLHRLPLLHPVGATVRSRTKGTLLGCLFCVYGFFGENRCPPGSSWVNWLYPEEGNRSDHWLCSSTGRRGVVVGRGGVEAGEHGGAGGGVVDEPGFDGGALHHVAGLDSVVEVHVGVVGAGCRTRADPA